MKKLNTKIIFNVAVTPFIFLVLGGVFLLPALAAASPLDSAHLIDLSNTERVKNGLSTLRINKLLTQAAQNKAQDILKYQKFAHTINERRFSNWVQESGYDYAFVGENLAIDFQENEEVIQAWLDSPLHRQNLLNPVYQEIGLVVLSGDFLGQQTKIVVQIFGQPTEGIATPAVLGISEFNQPFEPKTDFDSLQPQLTDAGRSYFKETDQQNWIKINEDELFPLNSQADSAYFKLNLPTVGWLSYLLTLTMLWLILDTYHYTFAHLRTIHSNLNLKIKHF